MSNNEILIAQHVTEKGSKIGAAGQYLFKVNLNATKKQIQQAVEAGFNVKVKAVNTVKMKGKTRRFGQKIGKKSDWKKAYITLAQGHVINFELEPAAVSGKD